MKELYFDYGYQNLLFIRYNPDTYIPTDKSTAEKKHQRLKFLSLFLKEQMNSKNFENLAAVYLFYDGFSRDALEFENIDPHH